MLKKKNKNVNVVDEHRTTHWQRFVCDPAEVARATERTFSTAALVAYNRGRWTSQRKCTLVTANQTLPTHSQRVEQ